MKRTAYERAVEINERLRYLDDLMDLLNNSANNFHNLAAIKNHMNYGDSNREIANELKLDPEIRDKFIEILRAEQDQLRDEFDRL